jgi:thioredoxin reductase
MHENLLGKEPIMHDDVIIIGGSFAGLSAAMQLARSKRRVTIVDAGRPRNRFTHAAHGFLGQDGVAPAVIRATARAQLERYPTFRWIEGEAVIGESLADGFRIGLADGADLHAGRLVIACGVTDSLPDIAGLGERWGRGVFHCPYCDGYETGGAPIGVLSPGPLGMHQALLLPDWGPTTLYTQGTFLPDEAALAQLGARQVTIEPVPVVELLGSGDGLEALRLADGRIARCAGLFVQPKTQIASPLPDQLGLAMEDGATGRHIRVDDIKQTSLPCVFAAGDAASAMHNATFASAAGVMAAVAAHRSLVMDIAGHG